MAQIGQFPPPPGRSPRSAPEGRRGGGPPRVQLAGGQLQQQTVERIAVLPHQRHVVRLIQCQNGHAPWVEHHLPLGGPPSGRPAVSSRTVMIRPWNIVLLSMVRSVRSIFRSLPGASHLGRPASNSGPLYHAFPRLPTKSGQPEKKPRPPDGRGPAVAGATGYRSCLPLGQSSSSAPKRMVTAPARSQLYRSGSMWGAPRGAQGQKAPPHRQHHSGSRQLLLLCLPPVRSGGIAWPRPRLSHHVFPHRMASSAVSRPSPTQRIRAPPGLGGCPRRTGPAAASPRRATVPPGSGRAG